MTFETPPPTTISADPGVMERLKTEPISVLCGRNNSGKSFVLRRILEDHDRTASYLGPARYQNFTVLSPFGPNKNRKEEKWLSLIHI